MRRVRTIRFSAVIGGSAKTPEKQAEMTASSACRRSGAQLTSSRLA